MSIKPEYIFFYTSDNAVDKLVEESPFRYDKPISFRKSKENARIEYEHFDIKCFKTYSQIGLSFKGHKAWQVLVEDILYDQLTQKNIDEVLLPMMYPFERLGGRVVRIDIYREEKKPYESYFCKVCEELNAK